MINNQLNFTGMNKPGTDQGMQLDLFTGKPDHQHITEQTEAVKEAIKANK